jgi:diacylglycerol kinase (ATP)
LPRLLLLINPHAGSGAPEAVEKELRAQGAELTTLPIHRVAGAASIDVDRIAVAGGDGSIGPAAVAAARAGVPLAVIPSGTANDFARALSLPLDPASACRLAVQGSRTRAMELGSMGERPFVNVASAGLPPAAARAARGWKGTLGPFAYFLGAARAGLTAAPIRCAVRCDGIELFAGEAWQVTVACSGAFGAGASVGADPGDGLLDVVVVGSGSRLQLVRRAYGLRSGRIRSQPGVRDRRSRSVSVEVPPETEFNVDGELCRAGPVEFSVQGRAFEVVVG